MWLANRRRNEADADDLTASSRAVRAASGPAGLRPAGGRVRPRDHAEQRILVFAAGPAQQQATAAAAAADCGRLELSGGEPFDDLPGRRLSMAARAATIASAGRGPPAPRRRPARRCRNRRTAAALPRASTVFRRLFPCRRSPGPNSSRPPAAGDRGSVRDEVSLASTWRGLWAARFLPAFPASRCRGRRSFGLRRRGFLGRGWLCGQRLLRGRLLAPVLWLRAIVHPLPFLFARSGFPAAASAGNTGPAPPQPQPRRETTSNAKAIRPRPARPEEGIRASSNADLPTKPTSIPTAVLADD